MSTTLFDADRSGSGKRVLVVEDEMLVAMLLEAMLVDLGYTPVGPFGTVATALDAVINETFDLAVLDVNLCGEKVYPVAHALAAQRTPFLFVSGYGDKALPPGHDNWMVCPKPFTANQLDAMLAATLKAAARSAFAGSGD